MADESVKRSDIERFKQIGDAQRKYPLYSVINYFGENTKCVNDGDSLEPTLTPAQAMPATHQIDLSGVPNGQVLCVLEIQSAELSKILRNGKHTKGINLSIHDKVEVYRAIAVGKPSQFPSFDDLKPGDLFMVGDVASGIQHSPEVDGILYTFNGKLIGRGYSLIYDSVISSKVANITTNLPTRDNTASAQGIDSRIGRGPDSSN